MTLLLSVVAIVFSILAIFAYQWVTLVPKLGIGTLYRLRWVRFAVAAVALGAAVSAYVLDSTTSQLVVLLVTIALTPLSGSHHAKRFLVSLDAPKHVPTHKSDLGDDAPVLGVQIGDAACAWPLEVLAPHHIVNDRVGDLPVLAAW